MKWMLTILTISVLTNFVNGQFFSLNCAKSRTITTCRGGCNAVTNRVPDVHQQTSSYTVNPIPDNCFPVYADPATGAAAGFTADDTYYPLFNAFIGFGFPFPFYDTVVNGTQISPNGIIRLKRVGSQTSLAEFALLNQGGVLSPGGAGTPENYPSALHEPGVIGLYEDINPAETTSPFQSYRYQQWGVAPHRRWIMSYNLGPFFNPAGATCNTLINTHQIVIYESLAMAEVLIWNSEICPQWNRGHKLIGMQDMSQTRGIMAPGREATAAPWRAVLETWRFVPSAGRRLYKRSELLLNGVKVADGVMTDPGNGMLDITYPVCPPDTGNLTYIMQTVYEKIDNPAVEIFSRDTLFVRADYPNNQACTYLPVDSTDLAGPDNPDAAKRILWVNSGYYYFVDKRTQFNYVRIWDASGRQVVKGGAMMYRGRNKHKLPDGLAKGWYIIKVCNERNGCEQFKFIIE